MPTGFTEADRRAQLDLMGKLNQRHLERHRSNLELEARSASYELAFRMQMAAPEAFDLSGESEATKKLYGIDQYELYYEHQNRKELITVNRGEVIKEVFG